MRVTFLYVLAVTLPALSVVAQRNRGGGGGRNNFFNPGGGNDFPNTFITIASAAPAATPGTGFPAPASRPDNSPPDDSQTDDAPSTGASSDDTPSGSVDPSLIPPFGITAGVEANDGTGNCVGEGGKGIPCDCPPDLNTFVSAVEDSVAGGAAFPSGNSAANQLTRLQTCIVTLQNFKGGPGSGVGCPAVSTTWKALQAQLQSEVK